MPKGFFTQSFVILLKKSVSLDAIAGKLSEFDISNKKPEFDNWMYCGPSLIVEHQPDCNAKIVIDVVDKAWPDDMGDMEEESELFGAWGTGQFGPFVFPGSLARSMEQSWAWPEGKTVPEESKAFIRIRSSFVIGLDEDAEIVPENYDSVDELDFMTSIAEQLLSLPEALCFFNPNGEVLRDKELFDESIQLCGENEILTVDLWTNVRLFRFDDEWALMDTVGNHQMDIPDIEACFDIDGYEFSEVDQFLRMVTMFLLENPELDQEHALEDQSGVTWQVWHFDDSLCDPPRPVIRLIPQDGKEVPAVLIEPSNESNNESNP